MHCLSSSAMKTNVLGWAPETTLLAVVGKIFSVLLVCGALLSFSFAQPSLLTSHGDNQRTGANLSERLLAPSYVS